MNYANMIEEKNLKARRAGETPAEMDKLIRFSKKTFIIATLCSTLIGTFTSSMGLWDRVSEKRRQKHRDTRQDAEIKQLKDQVERNERDNRERSHRERDDLGDALGRSGALIRHEYDQGYEHLGRRFAVGDSKLALPKTKTIADSEQLSPRTSSKHRSSRCSRRSSRSCKMPSTTAATSPEPT